MHAGDCPTWPDAALARAVAFSDARAADAEAELCRRFTRRVRLYGLRHLRDPHAADDLAQRAMLLTIEKLRAGAIREPDAIGSFILGVARKLAHDTRRRTRLEVPAIAPGGEPAIEDPPGDPLARAQLTRCLQQLAERERSVVVLTYFREAPTVDIARSLGLAEGNVRVVRHRAMGRLRDCMTAGPAAEPRGRA